MYSCYGNSDGAISMDDKVLGWSIQAGSMGFLREDYKYGRAGNNLDKDSYWVPNNSKSSFIPE